MIFKEEVSIYLLNMNPDFYKLNKIRRVESNLHKWAQLFTSFLYLIHSLSDVAEDPVHHDLYFKSGFSHMTCFG